jgi:hypothetical protein
LVISALGTAAAAPAGPGSWSGVVNWNNFVAIHLSVSPTGDVLMWDREQGLTSARRWNPATGAFSPTPGLNTALFCAFQTRLPGGQLVVVGGTAYKQAGAGLEQTRIFDWASSTWSVAASMKTPRWYPTVVALPDGRQVALGGQVRQGVMANLIEVYNPSTNTWRELPGAAQANPLGTYPRAILGPNGRVFVVKNGAGKSAYLDVDNQTWTTISRSPAVPGGAGLAMYDSGKLLLYAAGTSGTNSFVIDLNAASPAWRQVGSLQFKRKKFSTVVLPDGRVMAIGGSVDGSSTIAKAVLTPEVWDPATEKWTALPNHALPRMYHSNALLLPDGRVLTAGGGRSGSAPNYPNAEFYSPQYLALVGRPAITSTNAVWTSAAKATLTVSSANGVSSVVLMGLPAVTHGIDTAARRLVLPVTSPWNSGTGSIEVQVPSIFKAPPGHYYAIALDSRGVPSRARIVQVLGSTGPPPASPTGVQPEAARTVADPTATEPD